MKRTYQPSVTKRKRTHASSCAPKHAADAQYWPHAVPKAANAWQCNFGLPLRKAVPLVKNG